jgi:hypothetical protein
MKQTTPIAIAALLAVSVVTGAKAQDTNSVYSVNIVGFQQVQLPDAGQFMLSAVPFSTGESNTLSSIFGTNTLKQSGNYLLCDRVILFNEGTQTYETWAQFTDGQFYKAGSLSEWNQSIAGDPIVPAGRGYWILSASDAPADRTLTYSGNVVVDESVSVSVTEGFQILAYPFSSDIALEDLAFVDSGAVSAENYLSADRILLYEDGAYETYALYTDNVWYKAGSAAEWNQSIPATDVTIRQGQAFFYQSQQPLTWLETNAYLNVLLN